ncbi:MAG TPA: M48 family metallopeptidase, partial [Ramlibacter sp.]|nr:M48 family metallopeptidase [Ramlibacter sp.]
EVGWPEAWSARRLPAKLVVDLRAHGSLELDDVAGWQGALASAGHVAPLAQRMQTRWGMFLAVLLVAAAGLGAFYRWGTPWTAAQLTRQVPLSWELTLSEKALQDMDAQVLRPSRLPTARQQQLRQRFDALAQQVAPALRRYPDYRPQLRLQFRRGLGANAFALPGGTIVLTDGMVEAAANQRLADDALLGVLAHEIGHVMHRHTTRLVVEQGVLNVGLGLALGDLSSLVSTGASVLTGLAYRRNHETEADCFALALMQHAGRPIAPMADLLLQVDAQAGPETGEGASWTSLLSSHPGTPQRARQLKSGTAPGCG